MAIGNRDRGTTSTGLSIIDKDKEVTTRKVMKGPLDAIEEQSLFDYNDEFNICLVHNRAPSVGTSRTIDQAHPVEYKNIVLVHNGTIHNKTALAEKYKVKVEHGDTDTAVLAKILEKGELDVLNDYNGAASLLWYYKDDPESLYVFRGESKNSAYSNTVTEERPLYQYQSSEGFYFASVEASLKMIADNEEDLSFVKKVDANKVFIYSLNYDEFIVHQTIDRTRQQQLEVSTYNQTSYVNKNKHSHKANNKSTPVTTPAKVIAPSGIFNVYATKLDIDFAIESVIDTKTSHVVEFVNTNIMGRKIHYYRGRYWRDSRLLNGIYHVDGDGNVFENSTKETELYAFVQGWLLKELSMYSGMVINTINLHEAGTAASMVLLAGKTDMPIMQSFQPAGTLKDFKYYKSKGTLYKGVYNPKFASIKHYVFDGFGNVELSVNFLKEDLKVGDTVLTKDWTELTITNTTSMFDDSFESKNSQGGTVVEFIDQIFLLNNEAYKRCMLSDSMQYVIDGEGEGSEDSDDSVSFQDIQYCVMDSISALEGAVDEIKDLGSRAFQESGQGNLVDICESELDKLNKALKILQE